MPTPIFVLRKYTENILDSHDINCIIMISGIIFFGIQMEFGFGWYTKNTNKIDVFWNARK